MNAPWYIGRTVDPTAFAVIRRKAIFECCKWDVQVEDTATLCPFPLVLKRHAWDYLASTAEQLAAETLQAEQDLIGNPRAQRLLGIPGSIRRILQRVNRCGSSLGGARIMRFDFHWTTEGWRISEVNSDVPGGLNESSGFTRLIADQCQDAYMACDPAVAYADEIARYAAPEDLIGLVHATAYSDDRQVMEYLARTLAQRGLQSCFISPEHIRWRDGQAYLNDKKQDRALRFIVRFFPAEWLPELPRRTDWEHFFAGSRTVLSNPASALLTQSKRFPLVWHMLRAPVDTWRDLLPETCDPGTVDWQHDSSWVLKPALGRVGDGIGMHGATPTKQLEQIRRAAYKHPEHWVAQRQFTQIPVQYESEQLFPCIGIYTIGGKTAGVYGRLSTNGLTDFRAREIAVLVESPLALAAI